MESEILLATRFGPASAGPAAVAAELARKLGGHITVLYVAGELDALAIAGGEAGIDPAVERERILTDVQARLDEFIAQYLPDLPSVGSRVEQGNTPETVAAVAAEIGARFLVVGTRGRGHLARLVLGDTTQDILHHTPCPVVVVPIPDDAS